MRCFLCDGKQWDVERSVSARSAQTGLLFHSGGQTRFLPLTRGTLPTDRELSSITDTVLCVLLQRSHSQPPSTVRAGTDT
jgi:hypothetical protein